MGFFLVSFGGLYVSRTCSFYLSLIYGHRIKVVQLYHPFHVCGIYSDAPISFLILVTGIFFFLLVSLARSLSISLIFYFKEPSF